MSERYNGWSNHSTWLCALWMDNDGDYFIEEAKNYKSVDALAKAFEETWHNFKDELLTGSSFFTDLVNAGMREIDWREIAEHYFEEEEEEDEEEDDVEEDDEQNERQKNADPINNTKDAQVEITHE